MRVPHPFGYAQGRLLRSLQGWADQTDGSWISMLSFVVPTLSQKSRKDAAPSVYFTNGKAGLRPIISHYSMTDTTS